MPMPMPMANSAQTLPLQIQPVKSGSYLYLTYPHTTLPTSTHCAACASGALVGQGENASLNPTLASPHVSRSDQISYVNFRQWIGNGLAMDWHRLASPSYFISFCLCVQREVCKKLHFKPAAAFFFPIIPATRAHQSSCFMILEMDSDVPNRQFPWL